MAVECMGDTPQTVLTIRAPAVLINICTQSVFVENIIK